MKTKSIRKSYKAATLIEVAISVFLAVVLISIVIMLFNPSKKTIQKRNDTRTTDVASISNAISLYLKENGSWSLTDIPVGADCLAKENQICKTGAANCEDMVDLNDLTKSNKYLTTIPVDPKNKLQLGTGYNVVKNEEGLVTVCAPLAESGADISISK